MKGPGGPTDAPASAFHHTAQLRHEETLTKKLKVDDRATTHAGVAIVDLGTVGTAPHYQ